MTVAIAPPRRANLYMLPRFSVSYHATFPWLTLLPCSLNYSLVFDLFHPLAEAVQVLVSLLADDSSLVRAASVASLKDIAALNPLLVLECCAAESRGGRRRFGNMAEILQVMAYGVRALDKREIDKSFMAKLSKIATSEIIPSKVSVFIQENSELNSNWLQAATSLLVAIGSHLPDLMMEEIYLHLSGPASALPAMVQILAEFASSDRK